MPGAAVFTYGTLTFADVIEAVTGRAFAAARATLAGFASEGVRGAVYPAARPCPGASVEGVLYLDVDLASLERLDRFEGELYERRIATVVTADGAAHAAQVYLGRERYFERLDGVPWDRERFAREHLASYLARCRASSPR